MKTSSKKLFWLSYATSGLELIGGPNIGPDFLEYSGSQVEISYWAPSPKEDTSYSALIANRIFENIEGLVPDIVAIAFDGNSYTEEFTDEPSKLIEICARIRNSAILKQTKIMAFFRMNYISQEKEVEWQKRYDYYSAFPIRVIEHAKVAKQLVGEELDNVEDLINYFSKKCTLERSKYIVL